MLDPEYILRISEGAEDLSETLHNYIIKRIVERIMIRIGRGDNYLLTAVDKWNIQVLQDAGYLLEDIQKEIAKITKRQEQEIKEAMEDAGVKTLEYDDEVYKAAGLSPTPLMQSPSLIRIMQRNYNATLGEWKNFTRTTAMAAQRAFISALDKAYTLTVSGTISYSQAVREAINEVVSDGVVVRYKNEKTGLMRKDTIETATLRAVRTGISQMSGQVTDARMEEMNWDIILTSAHLGARVTDEEDLTNHFWWQGKFYSRTGKNKQFPPFSVCGMGHVQGIHGANCRHSHGPGDGEHNPFENYDSEENRKAYELSQKQREKERRIRNTKREVMGLKDAVDSCRDEKTKFDLDLDYQKKAALLQKQNKDYNDFCKENGLRTKSDRLMIAKWDRQQAAAARGAAQRYRSERESMPRRSDDSNFSVKWDKINSPQYKEKFSNLTTNSKVSDAIYTRAKWALNNRDGKNTEELYAVSLKTGQEVARIIDQSNSFGVKRNSLFERKLYEADNAKEEVLLIHNHPRGLPPSLDDLNVLVANKNVSGITVGHDGSIYYYTRPEKIIDKTDFFVAMRRYSRYTERTGMEKALIDLSKKYGFTFKEL